MRHVTKQLTNIEVTVRVGNVGEKPYGTDIRGFCTCDPDRFLADLHKLLNAAIWRDVVRINREQKQQRQEA